MFSITKGAFHALLLSKHTISKVFSPASVVITNAYVDTTVVSPKLPLCNLFLLFSTRLFMFDGKILYSFKGNRTDTC